MKLLQLSISKLPLQPTKHRITCNLLSARAAHSNPTSTIQQRRSVGLQLHNPTPSIPINQTTTTTSTRLPEDSLHDLHSTIVQPPPNPLPSSPHPDQNSLHPINSKHPKPKTSRRPTKQVIQLTPKAIEHLSALLLGPTPRLIRIGVKNKGCAGMAYNLEYVEKPGKFDEVVTTKNEQGKEIKILIDSRALFSIIGSTMDWQETKLGNKFVFDNPNIKEECGCGESFLV